MNLLNMSPFMQSFNQCLHSRNRLAAFAFACSCLIWVPLNSAQSDWLNLGLESQQERYTIKFTDVNATEFINFVSRISAKNFIYDSSQIQFNISIVSDEPASSEEILATLMQIMRMNGFSVTEEGNNILFYKAETPVNSLARVITESDPTAKGLITRVYKLRYASVSTVKDIITKLASDETRVAFHEPTRQIIVCDSAGNVQRISELIQVIDQIDSTQEIEIYKVKHSNLAALKSSADQILAPFGGSGTGQKTGISSSLTIIPNMNASSLFLIGSRQMIDRAISVLTALDVPSELEVIAKSKESRSTLSPNETDPSKILDAQINPEFYIYKLQYHPGDEILNTLTAIGSSLTNAGNSQTLDLPLLQAMQTLQWLPSTNSLLFSGDDATIIKLRNLIQGLDTPVKQVFIEALIIDTTINNANAFGVEIGADFTWGPQRISSAIGNFRKEGTLRSDVDTNFPTKSTTPPTSSPSGFSAGVIGSAISHKGRTFGTIGALITAVQSDLDTRIVLNPKILTEDNVPCEFFVGQEVRIKSGIVQNSGNNNVTSSNFEIFDIGTRLRLTPTISTDDLVTLAIEQETSSPLDASNASDQSALVPLTQTSRTTTRLHVPDRHFVVLGGMIDDSRSLTATRVPVLGSIPLLGFLFRSHNKSNNRRNLLFFIRPHIVRTSEEARLLTDRYKDIVKQGKYLPQDIDKQVHFIKANDKN